MMIELSCGNCDSRITMDAADDKDAIVLDFAQRFTQAHEDCGFIDPPFVPENINRGRVIQTPKSTDTD